MKTTLCLFAATALLCGCNKPAAPTSPVRWEYNNFKFSGYKVYDFGATFNFLGFYAGWKEANTNLESPYIESNMVGSVEMVLNQVGRYGWELAWSDGTNFIVKRPVGVFTSGNFYVGEFIFHPK